MVVITHHRHSCGGSTDVAIMAAMQRLSHCFNLFKMGRLHTCCETDRGGGCPFCRWLSSCSPEVCADLKPLLTPPNRRAIKGTATFDSLDAIAVRD